MVRRQRTAKKLGQRHDLNYFKRWSTSRKLRVGLSLLIPMVALAWFAYEGLRPNPVAFSSGPMSNAHALIGDQCDTCHTGVGARAERIAFSKTVADAACLACHEAPKHKANETFTPGCASCHLEHVGAPDLRQTADQSCTQCHADLKTKAGASAFANVSSFNTGHPEFRVLQKANQDRGTIAFNHALHMKPIAGPKGKEQLECADCHRADERGEWRFPAASFTPPQNPPRTDEAYLTMPTFERNCAACHALPFDPNVTEPVPHVRPAEVRAFMEQRLRQFISENPEAARGVGRTRVVATSGVSSAPRSPEAWVKFRLAEDERLLWRKTCKQCHQLDFSKAQQNAGLPDVLPARMTAVWLPHATFTHKEHISIDCASCHAGVNMSVDTRDLLIPGIDSCRQCHDASKPTIGHAQNGCFECHDYHDWSQKKPFRGRYSIEQLKGRRTE